jgi:repressor LexA
VNIKVHFKNIILSLRNEKGFSQEQLAKVLHVSKSTVAMWETGQRLPSVEKYEEIADYFNVDMDFLYGRTTIKRKSLFDESGSEYVNSKLVTDISHRNRGVEINVLGRVAAGIPIEAIEDIIDTEEISSDMARTGEFFGLKIHGDSMEPRMCEGDVVIVRKQDDAESGEIVIATVNGSDATCKRLRKYRDGIELISNNPAYNPMFYSNEDIENKPVRIIGKVVELRGKF